MNAGSATRRFVKRFVIFLAVLLFAGGIFGSLWVNRDVEPVKLTIATGERGSDADILIREVAEVVARHSDTLRIVPLASRSASENIARLNGKQVDVGVIRADTPVVSNIRIIAGLFPDVMHVISVRGSGFSRINHLSRARVSIPEFGTDAFRSFWVIGDHYDLPIDLFDWTAESFAQGADRLLNGDADVLFTMRSLRDARLIRFFEEAQLKKIDLHYIPIDQADAISIKRPFLGSAEIPKGAFTGATPVPNIDTPTGSVERILVTRDDVDEEAIRELTRILFEHRLDLTIRFSLASAISQPNNGMGLSVPLHDGAQAYYNRDEPSFIQENAEPLALLVTVFTLMLSGLFALRSRFNSGRKNRADTYNHQLLEIQKRALLEDDVEELAGMKIEINDVLQTIVIALDTDEVTEEGFQSFSLLWSAVRETINDRMRDLVKAK